MLIFVARPLAAFVASALAPFDNRERLMLGWAGLRGAIPIWLATFPVVAGVGDTALIFNVVFFVVVTSTLIQGSTFEPLAKRLGVVGGEPALPPPLIETGIIRELGGESLVWRVRPGDAAAGRDVKELGLPREALVNLIVRGGEALPPRGSTEIEAGDELHIVSRLEALGRARAPRRALARRPAGRAPGAAAAAARGAAGVLGAALVARPTATRTTRMRSRACRWPTGCAPAATAAAPWSRWPTGATPPPAPTSWPSAAAARSPSGARAGSRARG